MVLCVAMQLVEMVLAQRKASIAKCVKKTMAYQLIEPSIRVE